MPDLELSVLSFPLLALSSQYWGQAHWVEANQSLLEQKVLPSIDLLQQGETISKEDKYVREYTPEEWAKRQTIQQEESA